MSASGQGGGSHRCSGSSLNALTQCGRILCLIEDDLTGLGKNLRCRVEIVNGAEPFLLPFLLFDLILFSFSSAYLFIEFL